MTRNAGSDRQLLSLAAALMMLVFTHGAAAQVTYGPYTFSTQAFADTAASTSCAGGFGYPAGDCDLNVVGNSPTVCNANVQCAPGVYVNLGFTDVPITNVSGVDFVVFDTRFSADGIAVAVETSPGVFSSFIDYPSAGQVIIGNGQGCAGQTLTAQGIDLDDFGLPAGFVVQNIRVGALTSAPNCELDLTMAAVLDNGGGPACGNGVLDSSEQCDDGNLVDGDGCNSACFYEYCGNSVVDAVNGEVCDDGNNDSGDGCSGDCKSTEVCGNGVTDVAAGEACDDGNTLDGDGCQANCALPSCGDGIVDAGEICDDGNTVDSDGCSATCASDETCGNGIVDSSTGEVCDDGNASDGDGCSAACAPEACGNGVIDTVEVCDDGNTLGGDGCSSDCQSDESCGNGIVDSAAGELCDDGNTTDGDGCQATCTLASCGDGVVDAGELCDDGNTTAGDGCNATCTSDETCGNDVVDLGEFCDEGAENGQGPCGSDCQVAPAGGSGGGDGAGGGESGTGGNSGTEDGGTSAEGGCGCRVVTGGDRSRGLLVGLLLLGLALSRRRRSTR